MTYDIDSYINKIKEEKDIFSKAKYISHLLKGQSIKLIDLSKKLGIKPAYICHLNRLNKLPDLIIDSYYSKTLGISQLFLISRVGDRQKMIALYEEILKNNYTIRQTEERIREYLYDIKTKGHYIKPKEKEELINKFKEKYPDTKLVITQTRIKGKIIIETKGDLQKTSKVIKEIINKL